MIYKKVFVLCPPVFVCVYMRHIKRAQGISERANGERVDILGEIVKGFAVGDRVGKDREKGKERGAKSNKGKGAND